MKMQQRPDKGLVLQMGQSKDKETEEQIVSLAGKTLIAVSSHLLLMFGHIQTFRFLFIYTGKY